MRKNILYEFHPFQFNLIKKNANEVNSLILKPSKDIFLRGLEAKPKHSGRKLPVAILFHGYTSNYRRVAYIANRLISNGVAVILMNLRGHGKSSGKQKDVAGMQHDIDIIMNYVNSQKEYDKCRILMLGISLGAFLTLTAGYNHPNITHLIGLAGLSSPTDLMEGMTAFRRWRWKLIGKLGGLDVPGMIGKSHFTPKLQPQIGYNTKKLLLLHCKNDALVTVNNFWTNIESFRLEPENYTLFPNGAHSFSLIKDKVLNTIDEWLYNNDFYNAE